MTKRPRTDPGMIGYFIILLIFLTIAGSAFAGLAG